MVNAMMDDEEFKDDRPTRGDAKRNAQDLQELGMKLLELPEAHMKHFTIPVEVLEALSIARTIEPKNWEALRRQHQRIGSLMGPMDADRLRQEFVRYRANLHLPQASIRWAERLIEKPSEMTLFCEKFPEVDFQLIRQLLRSYQKSTTDEKKATSKQKLLKALRKMGI